MAFYVAFVSFKGVDGFNPTPRKDDLDAKLKALMNLGRRTCEEFWILRLAFASVFSVVMTSTWEYVEVIDS